MNGSSNLNRGFWALVNRANENVGMELNVANGTSNRGLVVNADIASTFNRAVEVNQNSVDVVGDVNDDQIIRISNGGISGGFDEFNNGFQLNRNNGGSTIFEMYENGTQTVNISGDGNAAFAGTVSQSSDLRLKSNIQTLENALDNTLNICGVFYTWLDTNKTQKAQIGVIAQEVKDIYPEFVYTDDKGMKSVNYSQMVAVLVEAEKELNAKIEVLESENVELRAQNEQIEGMKAQINSILQTLSTQNSNELTAPNK